MGILNWVHNKFNSKQEKRRSDTGSNNFPDAPITELPKKEELCNWQQGLLSIGTLGNRDIKEEEEIETEQEHFYQDSQENSRFSQEYSRASQELPDFTIEEVKKLQEALTKLLKRKPKSGEEEKAANLPLDRFLNCPSSLEVERTGKNNESNNNDPDSNKNEIGYLSPQTKMILCKARDLLVNNNKSTMKQKSLKFLLKKLFVCGGGFMPKPGPSLRDPTPESKMDKLFKTVLQKKMFSQSAASSSRKNFLENKSEEDDDENRRSNRHKWVKTDSEYIVLEI